MRTMRANQKNAAANRSGSALPGTSDELCLLAPRQLDAHLRWVAESALPGQAPDLPGIAQRWRDARQVYRQLEVSQATAADDPAILKLPKAIAAHAAALVETPSFRHSFDTVPVAFGMVELDKLVVSQYCITQALIDQLRASHVPPMSNARLAGLCLPLLAANADFKLVYRDDGEFVFAASAHDMRFLGASILGSTLVDLMRVDGLSMQGHPQAVVALGVGYSSNVMNAVRLGNRLVLNNGHHRAYALRAMGFTHAPCVIQVCASHEELTLAATTEIVDNSDLYFDSPRPPLLRDFDNPALTHNITTARLQRQLRIAFSVESRLIAA